MREVDPATLDTLLAGPTPVVVEFWNDGCSPCRALEAVMRGVEDEYRDVRFVTVNADRNPELVQRFGVLGTPTLLIMTGGVEQERLMGARPKTAIRASLDRAGA